jgi:hypothetical protein
VRVLVACEFSGIVRDAFLARGHEALSCDLLASERPGPHYQGDVLDLLVPGAAWDLVIAHPPCTYLANSGVRWLYGGKGTERDPARWADMEAAAAFFRVLLEAPVPRVAVENPIQHGHAGLPKPTQVVQPWWFGHGEIKATGLWLRGLPPLVPTNVVVGRAPRVHHASPGPDRWKVRSRTLTGLAAAMAAQWG